MPRRAWVLVAVTSWLAAACAEHGLPAEAPVDAGEGSDASGDAGCVTNVVPLELSISPDDVADSQVIPVTYEGVEAYLAIDTGAPLTFVFGDEDDPEYVEDAGRVEVGCELFPVSALTLEAIGPEPFRGREIIGIVGMDFFSEVPTEIDYPGERVVRHLGGAVPSSGLAEWTVEWTGDRILVDAVLDGEPVRLMYDTGAPHTIWVGRGGRPGDEEIWLGTADGEAAVAYEGTATLTLGDDDAVEIPVWRAPELPYVEEELMELEAQGLLGASGLGFRRVVFDLGASRMRVGPRVAPRLAP